MGEKNEPSSAITVAEFFAKELDLAMNAVAPTSIENAITLVRRVESPEVQSLHMPFNKCVEP